MHLNLLHIDSASTGGDGDLVSVTSTVITVGGGELPELRAVFLEQGAFGEVGRITTGGQDHRTICGLSLSTKGVLDTYDSRAVPDELGDASLLLDDDTFGVADREIFKTFHLGVRDDLYKRSELAKRQRGRDLGNYHAGKLRITTVGPWLTVTAKSSNLGKVELEPVLQPVDSVSGTTGQDGDKIVTSEVASLSVG